MFGQRKSLLDKIGRQRGSSVLMYVTSDRPGLETLMHQEVIEYFVKHLDKAGEVEKISLVLYTRGGSTLTAWTLVNLIRQYCNELEIIVPSKCHSAGTIMCLGADRIIMTPQATLSPIDPSVNTPLNPQSKDSRDRVPVSVEAIKGYIELAQTELGICSEDNLTKILLALSEQVHPLVLGEVYRSRSQIKLLAKKLIIRQLQDEGQIDKVIRFLCSDSGSHDYTISRSEAKQALGLAIEHPTPELYDLIRALFENVQADLCLSDSYDAKKFLGEDSQLSYSFKRGLVESIKGSFYFVSEGALTRDVSSGARSDVADNRTFEGWRFED